MSLLGIVSGFFSELELVYARSHKDKYDVYDLRFNCEKARYPSMRTVEQVIDGNDNGSHHLLLRDRKSGEAQACIRLKQHNTKRTNTMPAVYEEDLLVFGEPLIDFTPDDFSDADKVYISPSQAHHHSELFLLMHLAALAFSRLRFQKFLLTKMPCEQFKLLRSKGLLFEQTCYGLLENQQTAYFYASTEDGVSNTSDSWELYQHILGTLAHQVNQPHIEGHHSGQQFIAK